MIRAITKRDRGARRAWEPTSEPDHALIIGLVVRWDPPRIPGPSAPEKTSAVGWARRVPRMCRVAQISGRMGSAGAHQKGSRGGQGGGRLGR